MSRVRTIAAVTGSRADFGVIEPVLRAIAARPGLKLRLIVAGAHLISGTWRDVERAGFPIAAKVRMQKRGATGRFADAAALGRGTSGFADALPRIRPDFVLVLGDRIEALAAASAASVAGLRVVHVHGGDRAAGVADEAMRHAISKLAHLHLPATAASRRRLLRMGEPAERIVRAGSPAVDGMADVEPAGDAPRWLVVQHPIGATAVQERGWMRGTLAATRDGTRRVLAPNGDPGGEGVRAAIRDEGIGPVEHLPRRRWLALLAGARAVVGNSSAGLIEAAALKVPCVNIGPRQRGREKPANVIDCDYGQRNVRRAIREAESLDLRRMRHPYGDGRAGQRIAETLATVRLDGLPVRKHNSY